MTHTRRIYALTIALGLMITAVPSLASSKPSTIAGQWKNDQTGTTFYITPERNGAFAVIRHRTKKDAKATLRVMRATWVRGMRGTQFRFKKATGTVAHDAKTIRFAKYTWSKLADYPSPGKQAGFWVSSSGSEFLVTPELDGEFHVLNFTKLGSFISNAKWVKAMPGVQWQYKEGELLVTLSQDSKTARLVNRKTSKQFNWTRIAKWPQPSGSKATGVKKQHSP